MPGRKRVTTRKDTPLGATKTKQSGKTAKQLAKSKAVSHSKETTAKNKASKAKKKPGVSPSKRDAKGRFAPKVKKNVTKERFKKRGLKYRPVKPHAPVLRKKKLAKKDTTHLERVQAPPTDYPKVKKGRGKGAKRVSRFVPNLRSDPFRAIPRTNPETRTRLDPDAITEAVRQSLETELDSVVTGDVVSVFDHPNFLFHEYTFEFPDISLDVDSLEMLFELVRPFFRPHYRSWTNLIGLVGFEHESRQEMEIAPKSLSSTMVFDHAFMGVEAAVERWSKNTNYKAICGIALHIKAPDWMQPKDKQMRTHTNVSTSGKREGKTQSRPKGAKAKPSVRANAPKKGISARRGKGTRGDRKATKSVKRKTTKRTK